MSNICTTKVWLVSEQEFSEIISGNFSSIENSKFFEDEQSALNFKRLKGLFSKKLLKITKDGKFRFSSL